MRAVVQIVFIVALAICTSLALSLPFAVVAAQTDPPVFGTVHVVNALAAPSSETDWIMLVAGMSTSAAGKVWVYDAETGEVLLRPQADQATAANFDGQERQVASDLRRAVERAAAQASSQPQEALIDLDSLRAPLFTVLREAEDSHFYVNGFNAEEKSRIDVVLWADRLMVGRLDLSTGYLPKGCFGPGDQPAGPPRFLAIDVPDGLLANVTVRSLNPAFAAATAEAQQATLSEFLRNSEGAGAAPIVTEGSARCGAAGGTTANIPVESASDPGMQCNKTIASPRAPSACGTPMDLTEVLAGPTAPGVAIPAVVAAGPIAGAPTVPQTVDPAASGAVVPAISIPPDADVRAKLPRRALRRTWGRSRAEPGGRRGGDRGPVAGLSDGGRDILGGAGLRFQTDRGAGLFGGT